MKIMLNSVWALSIFCLIYLITNIYCDAKCGIQTRIKREKIVNGHDLEFPRKYPWYVALVLASNPTQLTCGGTLINDRHVLTAAHCFKPYFESVKKGTVELEDIYLAKLGIDNICINEEEVEVFAVIKVHIQEEYYKDLTYYDIAIMVLESEVTNFMPICLPPGRYESYNRTDLNGSIIGLGKESSTAWKTPCTVKEAFVPVKSDSDCIKMLNEQQTAKKFQGAFCAGFPEGGIDTCQGDSGGPLQVYRKSSASWMILGITSFGYGCAKPKAYGIYTDVSHYLDWIYDKIKYDEENDYEFTASTKDEIPAKRDKKRKRRRSNKHKLLKRLIHAL